MMPLLLVAAERGHTAIWMFLAFVAATLVITYFSARKSSDASGYFAAGRRITGWQNGLAVAGDYMSAASFLGIAGMIAFNGYDGFMYSVGFLVAYLTVLFVVAEPLRNAGKYTMADVLAYRLSPRPVRAVASLSTLTVSVFYMIAQMVGAGTLVRQLLPGVTYEVAVVGVGILMVVYVVFGGMVATTWVQIIKAVLLVLASLLLVFFTWMPYGFSLPAFLQAVVVDPNVQAQVSKLIGDPASAMTASELGQRFLEPGLYLKSPIDQISLGLALVFGTAGMPHILMRFFTVPTAKDARTSVLWAMGIIGGFYLLTLFLGLGAAINVGASKISSIDAGGNMAGPLLAQYIGGGADSMLGNLFLAFVAAVAFATIVAVVAGLVLASASAMSHDLWVGVIKGARATPAQEVRAARISSVIVGMVAIVIGILAKGQNVAHLVALAFAVAASSNLPAVLLTLYWKRCNTTGIVLGMTVGALSAIGLVMVSPNMTYPDAVRAINQPLVAAKQAAILNTERALVAMPDSARSALTASIAKLTSERDVAQAKLDAVAGKSASLIGLKAPLISLRNPGIISIPLGFLCVVLGSLLVRERRSLEMWEELYVRQNTGLHAEGASEH